MSTGPFAPGDTIEKDPNAVLDYLFDWSDWLAASETISTKTVALDAGPDSVLTIDSSAIASGSEGVTVWLSSGTVNKQYLLRCRIVTSASRTDDRSVYILVKQR